jgi:hypothetical protein
MSCIMRSSVAGALELVMRLCWADKVPLALFALITLFMLVLGAGANPDNSQYCKDIREIYPTWTSADSFAL